LHSPSTEPLLARDAPQHHARTIARDEGDVKTASRRCGKVSWSMTLFLQSQQQQQQQEYQQQHQQEHQQQQ